MPSSVCLTLSMKRTKDVVKIIARVVRVSFQAFQGTSGQCLCTTKQKSDKQESYETDQCDAGSLHAQDVGRSAHADVTLMNQRLHACLKASNNVSLLYICMHAPACIIMHKQAHAPHLPLLLSIREVPLIRQCHNALIARARDDNLIALHGDDGRCK
jgi:hypothetical protein